MYPLSIVAPDRSTETALRDRLAAGLAAEGRVAVVGRDGADADRPDGAATAYRLGDGAWTAAGTGADLRTVLERLAPDHDYALIAGHPDARVPSVAVGDVDSGGEVLLDAPDADAVAVGDVRDALADAEPLETLESLVEAAKEAPDADRAGAVATFTGRVRARDDPDDAETTHLEFEKYAGVAAETMAELEDELAGREGVVEVVMHHRAGIVEAGEDIVFVVVLAGHRGEAFRTVEDGIDRLKAEVPIFKKEVTVEESYWVHERQ